MKNSFIVNNVFFLRNNKIFSKLCLEFLWMRKSKIKLRKNFSCKFTMKSNSRYESWDKKTSLLLLPVILLKFTKWCLEDHFLSILWLSHSYNYSYSNFNFISFDDLEWYTVKPSNRYNYMTILGKFFGLSV